jgi:primosomal protein N' (replication factor Y)
MRKGTQAAVLVDVAVPLPIFHSFTYEFPEELGSVVHPGSRVLVPFGNRYLIGMVMLTRIGTKGKNIRPVKKVLDTQPLLSQVLVELGNWICWYYLAPPGEAFRVMLPPGLMAKRADPDTSPEGFWPAKKQLAVTELDLDAAEGLTSRQAEVIEVLAEQNLPVLLSDLVRETPCSHQVIQRLQAKKLVKLSAIDIYRSPWSQPRVSPPVKHRLSADQLRILIELKGSLKESGFGSTLVHGVTASGKTEIYLNTIASVLQSGKSALVLVPEIGLTPQISHQFRAWFQEEVAILHSGLSSGERFDQWRRIREGRARVVVGTRSAVFAPLSNLGLIIVDEEHDTSYKQADQPRYNGRDTALKRGQLEGVLVVLGSATPQLETYYQAQEKGDRKYLHMTARILERPLPKVHILDMKVEFEKRGKGAIISELLKDLMGQRLERREQTLILLNRRGYASALLCRSCGHIETCVNCSITLTYHADMRRLSCHYCGYGRSVPSSCDKCGKEYIHFLGEGTERIQEVLRELFPKAIIERLDRDTARLKGNVERILNGLRSGSTDILIGTQMIAKGHDFPGVTLVGVVGADQGLRLADFRAAERTFQLLTQVAGRAGRGDQPGEVVIQTYYPNHYALRYASSQDYLRFSEKELQFRKRFRYPPYVALASLFTHGEDRSAAWMLAEKLVALLREHRNQISDSSRLRILGPASAAIERLKKDYRVQVLIKSTDRTELHEVLRISLKEMSKKAAELKRITVDIDPVNLL